MSETQKTVKTPNVLLLKPITPTAESRSASRLEYSTLHQTAARAATFENPRQEKVWSSDANSLEEVEAARQLATQYILMTASKQNYAPTAEQAQLWGMRYTEASIELFGQPDAELARDLAVKQFTELSQNTEQSGVDPSLTEHYKSFANNLGIDVASEGDKENSLELSAVAEMIGAYMNETYGDAFAALDLENAPTSIDAQGIVDRFSAGLRVLAEQHDPSWAEWEVVLDPEKDSLSVNSVGKKIVVGIDRLPVSPTELKGLFAHEALLHAQRAVNGMHIDPMLARGLPGYLDAEEGLGTFIEYSVTGVIPEKNIDRYVDIAIALGQIDGQTKTRHEMTDFVTTRAIIRNECLPIEEQKPLDEIRNKATTHVNRIYRGTTGDKAIGVFTKDVAYQKGFMEMGAYIHAALAAGESSESVMKRLFMGKYDPTNSLHIRYINALQHEDNVAAEGDV